MVTITLYAKQKKETQMYRIDFWTLWEKARVGCSKRIALKQVYYQGWNRSPAQLGCMRQVLRVGALGWPRGMGWGGRWEGGLGWGTHVNPWLIHVSVWQKPQQYSKVISLQLIKINEKNYLLIFTHCGYNFGCFLGMGITSYIIPLAALSYDLILEMTLLRKTVRNFEICKKIVVDVFTCLRCTFVSELAHSSVSYRDQ